jgi:MoaA/NifB/PqqE/SkfB family radical SAM enzyme
MPFVENENFHESKICWRITRRCNLHCPHCLAGDRSIYAPEADAQTCLHFVKAMAECNVTRIVFTGGEPLIRADIFAILRRIQDMGITSQITTNALSITAAKATELSSLVDCLRISVDGLRGTHNMLRQSKSYNTVIRAITTAIDHGIRVVINTVVTSSNIYELPELLDTLYSLGVRKFVLLEFMLREYGIAQKMLQLRDSQVSALENNLHKFKRAFPDATIRYNRYSSENDRYIVVEPDGSVVLCSEKYPDQVTGNLRRGSLPLAQALSHQNLAHRQYLV